MSDRDTIDLVKIGETYGPKRLSSLRRAVSLVAAVSLLLAGLATAASIFFIGGGRGSGMLIVGCLTFAGIAAYWIYEDFIRALPLEAR